MGGAIAALIALRKWLLPLSEVGSSGVFGGPTDSNDTGRSFLGALAFAIPGALVLAWHLREARRRERVPGARASWGGVLYFHLVALISLLIALGGVVATLHSVRDLALPLCYETPRLDGPPVEVPSLGSEFEGEGSPIVVPDLPVDLDPTLIESRKECYPSSKEALRGALDGGIVASVAGVTWVWHLRRGRRALDVGPPLES